MTRHRAGIDSRRWIVVAAVATVVLLGIAVVAFLPDGPARTGPTSTGTVAASDPASDGATPEPTGSSPSARPTAVPSPSASAKPAPGGGPTAGLRAYTDTYKVQQPYDLPLSERFSVSAGPVYTAWIQQGDKPFSPGSGTGPRTEMRWGNWSGVEHLWEADVLIDADTEGTAVMQVKSNDGWEPIYVNVKNHGSLYNDSNHTVLATGVWGSWFHLTCGYDPVSGDGWVWFNGRLVITRHDPHPVDTVWYFKNGVYGITGARSTAHFTNVRFWTK